jgi:hypothetical protein
MNGALHPYHAARVNIGFQRGNGCCVRRVESWDELIIPVENDYPIIAEGEAGQLCGRKDRKRVPGSSDGILNDSTAPRIMRLEDGEFIRSSLAIGKGIINDVVS